MSVPQGSLVMLLCDDETGEMVDHVQGHIQLLHDLLDSLLLIKNHQADKLFAFLSITITEVLSCLINQSHSAAVILSDQMLAYEKDYQPDNKQGVPWFNLKSRCQLAMLPTQLTEAE